MSTEGVISIDLRLENGQFTATVANTGQVLRRLQSDLTRTADAANSTSRHFNSFSGHFRSFMTTVAATRFALLDIHQVFLALPAAFVKSSGEIERMTMLMTGLSKQSDELKRKQEGIADTKFVFSLAQNAPFEVAALSDSFVKLKVAGLDPTNGSLKTLVDSIAKFGGTSEQLKRASVAIQQMTGKGVISMEELRQQLGEAVPSAMQAMATGTGLSMAELVDKISKGTVEAKSALERMFAVLKVENDGAALKMMDSWVGQLAVLKTNWTLFSNEVGTSGGFFKEMKVQLEQLNAEFSKPNMRIFAHDLSAGLAATVRGIADLASFVRKYSDEIALAGKVMLTIWAGGKIVSAIGGVSNAMRGFFAMYIGGRAASAAADRASLGGIRGIIAAEREKAAALTANAAQELSVKRAAVLANGIENQKKIVADRAAAAAEIAAGKAKNAALLADAARYWAQHDAADKVATTRRLANGRFATAAEIANAKALKVTYAENANAAEIAAAKIRRTYASLSASHTAMMAQMRANTIQTTAELSKLGTTTVATASKIGILRGAVSLLGGPIGIITTLLTAGVFAWMEWGNAAKKAADKANDALARTKAGYNDLADVQTQVDQIAANDRLIAQKKADLSRVRTDEVGATVAERIKKEIAALEAKQKDFRANLGKARIQGIEGSIQDSVSAVARESERLIAERKAKVNTEIVKERELLDKKFAAKEIDAKKYAKATSELARRQGESDAKAEAAVYAQKWNNARVAMQKMEQANAPNFKKSALYLGYERQLAEMETKRKAALEGLSSASKIGTEPDYNVKQGKGGGKTGSTGKVKELSEYERLMNALQQRIAGVNAELDKEGSGTLAKLLEGYEQKRANGLISDKQLANLKEASMSLRSGMENLDAEKALDGARQYLAGLKEEAEGGSSALGKMKTKLEELLKVTQGDKAKGMIREALNAADEAKAIEGAKALTKSKELADDYRAAAREIEIGMVDDRRIALRMRYDLEVAAAQREIELRRKLNPSNVAGYEAEVEGFAVKQQAMLAKLARDSESPMQTMLRQWQDVSGAMEQSTAQWLDQGTDAFIEFAATGKFQFRDLTISILKDIAKIQMRKAIAGMMNMAIGALGGGGDFGAGAATSTAMGSLGTSAFSQQSMQLAGQVFANGGIMTEYGPATLRKYAMGGIANSPQIALYGEGSMAEAFVPLPDGRSIPVSFENGGSGGTNNVIINITVNKDGTEATGANTSGDDARAWRQMADRVKGVVRQELAEQTRPGGMIY
mgnify:CR=1 FL=1